MRTKGFTILELLIAGTIFVIALAVVYGVAAESTDTARVGTNAGTLEGQASRALHRMTGEIVAAGLATLEPPDPQGDSSLTFRASAGSDGGTIRWGPRQSLSLRAGEVIWIRDVDDPAQEVVLCGAVRPLAEGEKPNGIDDNGNGLVDEEGLSFELSGRTLTIRLTVERKDRAVGMLTRTVTTSVMLRN
ncbi:MAG: type II secretion system protein [Planctomycetota bacterium]